MEENTLTVLLIEDSPQFAQLVQHWLANMPGPAGFVLNWTDSLADGMSRLDKAGAHVSRPPYLAPAVPRFFSRNAKIFFHPSTACSCL